MKKYIYTFQAKIFAQDEVLKNASKFMKKIFDTDYTIGLGCSLGNITMKTGKVLAKKDLDKCKKLIKKHLNEYFIKEEKNDYTLEIEVSPAKFKGTEEDETTVER